MALLAISNADFTQPYTIVAISSLLYITYHIVYTVYDVFFGPLSKFPGPKTFAASNLPLVWVIWTGQEHNVKLDLHDRYGSVVRIAPNQLSYNTSQAWQDIYGLAKKGKVQMRKDPHFVQPPANGVRDLFDTCDETYHRSLRKIMSPAFSEKAVRDQETLLKHWTDLLVSKLKQKAESDEPINLVDWFNFVTTDIMSDLSFSESMGMLESGEYHPWYGLTFGYTMQLVRIAALESIHGFGFILRWVVGKLSAKAMREHFQFSADRADRRLQINPSKPDFWTFVMSKGEEGLSIDEMHSNAQIFMIAGTETSATLISGMMYQLLTQPKYLQKIVKEIRESFKFERDINISTLSSLPYLNACIEETLRIYPPVPTGFPRVTPEGGTEVDRQWIPASMLVSVSQYAANRSSNNFASPDEFLPERWLPQSAEDERFKNDDKAALQPFSVGPRDCIGRNLAYHESRLIISALLWNFECELDERSEGWEDGQKSYRLWMKPPLWVKLKVRQDVD